MVGRFGLHDEHGDVLEVDERASRLGLSPATNQIRSVRFLLAHKSQLCRIPDRWVIREWRCREAVRFGKWSILKPAGRTLLHVIVDRWP